MCKDHKSSCLILGFNLQGFAQDSHIVEKWKIKQEHGALDLFPPLTKNFQQAPQKLHQKDLQFPPFSNPFFHHLAFVQTH